jgi:hypothetical protein
MNREEIDIISDDIKNNFAKIEAPKICIHDLRRRLKDKQTKKNISNVIILFTLIFFIGFLLLFIY